MEISKVNSIAFQGLRKNNKVVNVKPNNHTARNIVVAAGLLTAGAVGTAVLIKKNKITLPNFIKKLNFLNGSNSQKGKKVANTIQAAKKPAQQAQTVVSAVEKNSPVAEEIQAPKAVEAIQPKTETVQPAVEAAQNIEETAQPVIETIQPKTETILPSNQDVQSAIEETVNREAVEIPQEAEKFTPQPIEKLVSSETQEEIRRNISLNRKFIIERKQAHPRLFRDFGTDKEIAAQFKKLDHELVREISDDEFLSILLAPTESLELSYEEKMMRPGRADRMRAFLDSTVLRKTKIAQKHRALGRKYQLHTVVPNILVQEERIAKLKKLEDIYTPEDMSKIFKSRDDAPRNMLLNWLIGFHSKSQDEYILENISDYL